jgi:hypothetical protein
MLSEEFSVTGKCYIGKLKLWKDSGLYHQGLWSDHCSDSDIERAKTVSEIVYSITLNVKC